MALRRKRPVPKTLGESLMALYRFSAKVFSRSKCNTVDVLAYRAGTKLYDQRTGETFDYRKKPVQHVELLLPHNAPAWAREIQGLMKGDRQKGVQVFSDIIEAAEKRVDARIWRDFELSLHRELTQEQNMALAREFVQEQLCQLGITAQLNFHFDKNKKTGSDNPHCHVVILTRRLEENGLALKKERAWNQKELLLELREQWAQYSNFHLKLNGYDTRIDHRSYKERGIDILPQPKMGRKALEQEKRTRSALKKRNKDNAKNPEQKTVNAHEGPIVETIKPFVFDKGEKTCPAVLFPLMNKVQAFRAVQLLNLYKIMRRPEVIFDMVSSNNSTFMWADVQKKLHQYVDERALFDRLETKLRTSDELILLRLEGTEDSTGKVYDHSIYTTRTHLKAERSLLEHAEKLKASPTHGVNPAHIENALTRANKALAGHGGLSGDQTAAIQHLVAEGQIKCVVGIAGAGKTTALEVCQEIWQNEGYAVYGLTPTGKASENLKEKNINATTLHKFLESFKEGRCQYNQNSVLILDEGGMVDVEHFQKLLEAVNMLGVKLIVVGDGAQLQPVEAGPAFRLITERVGVSELTTVLRQKEDWQKEATELFGQQKTQEALQKYIEKGCVHLVKEDLPDLKESILKNDKESVVRVYETSLRLSSLIYREILNDVTPEHSEGVNVYFLARQHQDYGRYRFWKNLQKDSAKHILENASAYRPLLEERSLDPFKMVMSFAHRKDPQHLQHEKAQALLKEKKLDHLIGIEKERGQTVDVRDKTKDALVNAWHTKHSASPDLNTIMLSYSRKDTNDLNQKARTLLKDSGHISPQEFKYTIHKKDEDDFGNIEILQEEKSFSKGDRLVFTSNDYGLEVTNGSMGTITELSKQKIRVNLHQGEGKPEREVSFSPRLYPYFDHGWAITVHKSQGTTVGWAYVLASYEMVRNLIYVAMTRHSEGVHLFGSKLDFWRPEKLPDVLSKSGEKLSAADYLDADSLTRLMQQEAKLLGKIMNRVSNELEAIGTVPKKTFRQVADHFLGITRDKEIRIAPDSIREEVRAAELFHQKDASLEKTDPKEKEEKTTIAKAHQADQALKKQKEQDKEGRKTFEQVVQFCEGQLLNYLAKANRDLTPRLQERLTLQSEKAAAFIYQAQRGTQLTQKELGLFFLRAKYELDRIPEIRQVILKIWQQRGELDENKSGLLAHHIAERLSSIEGRFYFKAKQKGQLSPLNIQEKAKEELKEHKAQTNALAKRLSEKFNLSENSALEGAKALLRYKEIHGQKPTQEQIASFAGKLVALERERSGSYQRTCSLETDYLRRKELDGLLLTNGSRELPTAHYRASCEHIRAEVQNQLIAEKARLQTERERVHIQQREMTL